MTYKPLVEGWGGIAGEERSRVIRRGLQLGRSEGSQFRKRRRDEGQITPRMRFDKSLKES